LMIHRGQILEQKSPKELPQQIVTMHEIPNGKAFCLKFFLNTADEKLFHYLYDPWLSS
jgi:hypothetical protein